MTITLATAKVLCNAVKCSLRFKDGEYRVNLREGNEWTAYYTDDRIDAIYTAVEMRRERIRRGF